MPKKKAPSPEKYPGLMRLIHWLMALLLLGMIAFGYWMVGLPKDHPQRMEMYDLHKSVGVLLLALVVLRFLVRLASSVPELPEGLAASEKKLAKAAHIVLYVLMFAVPLSGVVMSCAAGYGVKFFGFPLPNPLEKNLPMAGLANGIHEIIPYALLGLVALHVAGALKHRFVDKQNDVLGRML
ncbi:MAG: cytochrome b [Alphaproteobacteria bacterium]|nr:cytochrome b [Alphaproteobacteria bacterium]